MVDKLFSPSGLVIPLFFSFMIFESQTGYDTLFTAAVKMYKTYLHNML